LFVTGDVPTHSAHRRCSTRPFAPVIAVAKRFWSNSDSVRSFETRRPIVDVLKAMQHNDAYQAL